MPRKQMLTGAAMAVAMGLGVALVPAPASAVPVVIATDDTTSDDLVFAGAELASAGAEGTKAAPVASHTTGDIQTAAGFADPFYELLTEPANANPTTQAAWANAEIDGPDLAVAGTSGAGGNQLVSFDPGFAWLYAIVKPDEQYWVYRNNGSDNLLTTDFFDNAISGVVYLVPLPAAAWLMLTALGGLFGWRQWSRRGEEAVAA